MSRYYSIPEKASFVRLPRGVAPEACRFIGHLFATDETSVFSTRGALKEVHAAAFLVIEECSEPDIAGSFISAYAATPQKALYVDELSAPRIFKPKAISSLRVIAPHFATDGVGVYYDGVKIVGADAGSFTPLSSIYSLDSKRCFYRSARMVDANPKSLKLLDTEGRGHHLSHDASALYLYEQPIVKLHGSSPELRREEKGHVIGVFDGHRVWTWLELEHLYRSAVFKYRTVTLSEASSAIRYDDNAFAGLEEDFSMFLMLCSCKSIERLEELTRGKRGEKAVIRSIERLNDRLQCKLAVISPTSISVTSEGMAVYRQYGAVVDAIGGLVAAISSARAG
jgi:hypothetical protein